ncbi:50S ribosomal protein L30 [Arthrospiribacter ruber]|uniref:Large ribosomal subunit protein uL30 n=2 Tax=Arthrospiribacter ruber TaxID=2487934 RepID=A0A951MF66_9BACT|nr:50S ribosomal protein L30 [Arthrospiribacter ruber]
MLSQFLSKEVLRCLKYLTVKKMAKLKVTQVRSTIKRPKDQKDTIKALGLGKINRTVEVENNPHMAGMIRKVSHLIKVEEA